MEITVQQEVLLVREKGRVARIKGKRGAARSFHHPPQEVPLSCAQVDPSLPIMSMVKKKL